MQTFSDNNYPEQHQFFNAANSISSINIAFAKILDFVVTEIIKPDPEGTGRHLRLKNFERMNPHVVFSMTARTTIETRIEGVMTGPDDHISRTFNVNELKIKISNLLNRNGKVMQEDALTAGSEEPEEMQCEMDDDFIRRINLIIDGNLKNLDFDVGALKEIVGLSRVQLYRKLKAKTGLSPSSIINSQRMHRAAKLIRDRAGNLAEISLSVGFSNPSYFSRRFREFYGTSPKNFKHLPADQESG